MGKWISWGGDGWKEDKKRNECVSAMKDMMWCSSIHNLAKNYLSQNANTGDGGTGWWRFQISTEQNPICHFPKRFDGIHRAFPRESCSNGKPIKIDRSLDLDPVFWIVTGLKTQRKHTVRRFQRFHDYDRNNNTVNLLWILSNVRTSFSFHFTRDPIGTTL